MLIDLHCHTRPLSACSAIDIHQLVAAAVARGVEGICLTEHDRSWPAAELAAARASSRIPIFSGVELTTDMGHILAFGLDDPATYSAVARNVFEAAAPAGAVLYLAHPARDGLLKVSRETVEFFESVEAANGSDSKLQNLAAAGLARGFRLPGIGGSDAHTMEEVGRAVTRFPTRIESDAELVAALKDGKYEALSLR